LSASASVGLENAGSKDLKPIEKAKEQEAD